MGLILTAEIVVCASILISVAIVVLLGRYANRTFLDKLAAVRIILDDPDLRKSMEDKLGKETVKELDAWVDVARRSLEDGKLTIYEVIDLAKSSYPLVRKVLMYVLGTMTVISAYCTRVKH